ncbi:MAG: hypothetical protein U0893_14135 [Chloroflexota bacterium]
MYARKLARGLVTAALVAVAAASFQPSPANAAMTNPQRKSAAECIAGGFVWDSVKGCADKECDNAEAHGSHGDYYFGLKYVYYCDGFTGNWVQVRTNDGSTTSPTAPRPTTNGR